MQSCSPRGALARRRWMREQGTVSQKGSQPSGERPRLCAGPARSPRPGFLRGAPPELTIGGFASPVRLKEPCARASPALHHPHSIEPDRLSRHPSSNPSGWSPQAPARRRWVFDTIRHSHPRLQGASSCTRSPSLAARAGPPDRTSRREAVAGVRPQEGILPSAASTILLRCVNHVTP